MKRAARRCVGGVGERKSEGKWQGDGGGGAAVGCALPRGGACKARMAATSSKETVMGDYQDTWRPRQEGTERREGFWASPVMLKRGKQYSERGENKQNRGVPLRWGHGRSRATRMGWMGAGGMQPSG